MEEVIATYRFSNWIEGALGALIPNLCTSEPMHRETGAESQCLLPFAIVLQAEADIQRLFAASLHQPQIAKTQIAKTQIAKP